MNNHLKLHEIRKTKTKHDVKRMKNDQKPRKTTHKILR